MDKLAKELKTMMTASDDRKPKPYDTQAEVLRVEDGVAWVHIPGGVQETPVRLTMNAKKGDMVNVRVASGSAWITGNGTNPPTDDTTANIANETASKAMSIGEMAMSDAERARVAADSAEAEAGRAKEAAETALTAVAEIEGDISDLGERVETAEATVSAMETTVSGLNTRVATAEGKIATIEGDIDDIEGDVSDLSGRVSTAEGKVATAEGKVATLESEVNTLDTNVSNLSGRVTTAERNITAVEGNITSLQGRVDDAEDDIDDTLAGLALAQDVIGTLAWLTAHSTLTEDTTPVSGKSYYIKNLDNTFTLVEDTTGKNPAQEGWYEMDEAVSNYVATHMALTDDGLYIVADASGYKYLIKNDGAYIISPTNDTVMVTDYHSLQLKDLEGNTFLHVSDLRDADGYMTLTFTGDGEQTIFSLSPSADMVKDSSNVLHFTDGVVTLDNVETSEYELDYGGIFTPWVSVITFDTAPSLGCEIVVKYKPSFTLLTQEVPAFSKAFTMGIRVDSDMQVDDNIGIFSTVIGASSASGVVSYAEGAGCMATGDVAHAEGYITLSQNMASHSEGLWTSSSGTGSHSEGTSTHANGNSAHAEGYSTNASGDYSHTEGYFTSASYDADHAEGWRTVASGAFSHAEGHSTTAGGMYSHAEGHSTTASGGPSHAEGEYTEASGTSHAEGSHTNANGSYSHAEGFYTYAQGDCSHAQNYYTRAYYNDQTVIGKFNANKSTSAFEIGNGTSDANRANAFEVDWSGNAVASGDITDGSGNVLSNKIETTDLAAVAVSGSYTDLSNKPTIPVVPTNVSAFTNDAGYITSGTSTPTSYTVAEFDSNAHMNSEDMSSADVASFVASLNISAPSTLIDFFYPVGSYYETSDTSFNPNIAWSGTWVLETEGQVHISAGANYIVAGALTDTTDGGQATVTLTVDEIPPHHHTVNYAQYNRGTGNATASALQYNGSTRDTDDTGGGQPHENMQPYIIVNRWHRTA